MQKINNVVRKPAAARSTVLCDESVDARARGLVCHNHVVDLFPKVSDEYVIGELKKKPMLYHRYLGLNKELKKRYMDFMTGQGILPMTYDPFFKKLFNPDVYPERLSEFISAIIGEKVTVKAVLSNEDSVLPTNAILIMDIIVELQDGSIANVEIQRIGYAFAAERMSCYSSDLVIRQYSRVKGEKGKNFTYKDLRKVFTIVLFEESSAVFKDGKLDGAYSHYGRIIFDTGLELELLQEYYLVALDVFSESKYSERRNSKNAWLSLLTSDTVDDLERLVSDYPWLEAVCVDMAEYLHKPEEVLAMFSEALRILDDNTAQYMVDEMQKEICEKNATIEEQTSKIKEQSSKIEEQSSKIEEQSSKIEEQSSKIEEQKKAMSEKDNALADKEAEIERLKALLEGKRGTIHGNH